jgi:hypothetical protein
VVTFSGYSGKPSVAVISPLPGECIAAPNASSLSIPVTVDVAGTFFLRPPGSACADTYNCGYVLLYLDNTLNNAAGSATVNANLTSDAGLGLYGRHTLTVQLVVDFNDGGGVDAFDAGASAGAGSSPNGQYTASVSITVASSCADGGSSGDAGGSGDAGPGDAGDGG